ncbi:MAG: hypothetical protein CMK09_04300 [Ponticaulis sp.]|nr:hypothetical protein [Ponticaulis sp.]|tara:strand:+ start:4537 stop:5250 length:714 start_codon:yes stop_codon:yes gene_type:complete
MTTNGVIYIAFGEYYVNQSIFSAESLKRHNPDLPVTLFTDKELSSPFIDQVELIEPGHKRAKVDFIDKGPYDRSIYIDSDTKIVADITDVFGILDRFDVAGVHDFSRKSSRWCDIPEYDEIPYAFPEFNGGVLLFKKCEATDTLFNMWREYFQKYKHMTNGQDQASLRISLWRSGVQLHSLPTEFNVRNQAQRNKMRRRAKGEADKMLMKPRILHWHGLEDDNPLRLLRSKFRPMPY